MDHSEKIKIEIMENITCVILNAGIGRRLRPTTNFHPKCLLTINKQSLLDKQISALVPLDIKKFIISVGYKRKLITKKLKSIRKQKNILFYTVYNSRYSTTSTIYSLYLCLKRVRQNCILLNGDVVFDDEILRQLLQNNDKKRPLFAIKMGCADKEAVKVSINDEGYIHEISKEVSVQRSIGEFTGIAFFPLWYVKLLTKLLSSLMLQKKHKELFEYAIQESIDRYHIQIIPINILNYRFIEIDTYEDFTNAKKLFFNN